MRDSLMRDARGDTAVPLTDRVPPGQPQETCLYIALGPDGTCKVGTCAHCVRRFGAC